ncbi:hypothetical protein JTB14_000578 [Gonioctena quinquepunctata]|nr:hypothetical protein JTB14_000578 [Gonioctena quinquepunctata]
MKMIYGTVIAVKDHYAANAVDLQLQKLNVFNLKNVCYCFSAMTVATLRTEIADLHRHLDDLIETNKNLKAMIQFENSSLSAESLYAEIQDRATRSSNILIHNIEESSSRYFKERIDQDTLKCKQIFDVWILMWALSKYGD